MKLIVLGLLVVYVGGVWKFWRGFSRTNFTRSFANKVRLSLLWPALWATNPSYRQNFRKALRQQ